MKRTFPMILFSALIFTFLVGYSPLRSVCDLPEILVTRTDDPSTGSCSTADCSLRQAITSSNACPGLQTVRIPVGTYILTISGTWEEANVTGDLDITDSVSIVAEGMPVIDGRRIDRVLDIKDSATVQMTGLIIQNGSASSGAGIMNWGILHASKMVIQGNHDLVGGSGAGVFNRGNATITHSAIINNVSIHEAAGIYNMGNLQLDNVTITGNRGYGIMNGYGYGIIDMEFTTVANNMAWYEVWNSNGPETFRIGNSIIAGHVAIGNCFGSLTSTGYNIDTSSVTSTQRCGLDEPTDLNEIDPNLAWLGTYGGLIPVRALNVGSRAIDSADPARCFGSDPRGVLRPYGPDCDRGAFELNDIDPNPNETPTPVPSGTPAPVTKEPTKEFDEDGDGYSLDKDCNDKDPKINPDAFEIPDDKVDSNCNGEDNK